MAVIIVIADQERPIVHVDGAMEIPQDEETREEKPGIPKGVGNPAIQAIIGIRGRVVSHDRRAFAFIIVVELR